MTNNPKPLDDAIIQARKDGLTVEEIAIKLDRSHTTIRGIMHRMQREGIDVPRLPLRRGRDNYGRARVAEAERAERLWAAAFAGRGI